MQDGGDLGFICIVKQKSAFLQNLADLSEVGKTTGSPCEFKAIPIEKMGALKDEKNGQEEPNTGRDG